MGQKANPISLRLQQTNRHFDSCWYSDYYYKDLISRDYRVQQYINQILKQNRLPEAKFFFINLPLNSYIYSYYCNPVKVRDKFMIKSKTLKKFIRQVPSIEYKNNNISSLIQFHLMYYYFMKKYSKAQSINIENLKSTLVYKKIYKYKNTLQQLQVAKHLLNIDNNNNSFFLNNKERSLIEINEQAPKKFALTYKNYIESCLNKQLSSNYKLYFYQVNQPYQSAQYLVDEIVYYLERRITFRQIKTKLSKQIKASTIIKGIRISCSGRVGGRSKKAQRAKIHTIKYGQTSLHVFSSFIDYACKSALTPFGTVGVKVWICYHSN